MPFWHGKEAHRRCRVVAERKEPQATAGAAFGQKAAGETRAMADHSIAAPTRRSRQAAKLPSAERAGRVRGPAMLRLQRRPNQGFQRRPGQAQGYLLPPARRLAVQPRLPCLGRQVRGQSRTQPRQGERQVGKEKHRVCVPERVWQFGHAPPGDPLGGFLPESALLLDLGEHGEDCGAVARRLGEVGVRKSSLSHQRVEELPRAAFRDAHPAPPPDQSAFREIPAELWCRDMSEPAEEPFPGQRSWPVLGADLLRRPEDKACRRKGSNRVFGLEL